MHPANPQPIPNERLLPIVRAALEEDIGPGDATTTSTIPGLAHAHGWIAAREPCVLSGLALAEIAFRELAAGVQLTPQAADGAHLRAGQKILKLNGPARAILSAERVALNFLQRLSGIATLTAQFVEAVRGTQARILDTRKTTPGLRLLEKYAVTCGGGHNHRFGLYDMILIKDNHLAVIEEEKPTPIAAAVKRARAAHPNLRIEVEADTLEQVSHALAAGVDAILLDNMAPQQLQQAVQLVDGRAATEASGGVSLATVRAIAESGVSFISIGALTHSARAVDLALDLHPE